MRERTAEFAADLWPVWRDTEKALRRVITTTLLANYGERWVERLEKAHPQLKVIFERCRGQRQKDEHLFGNRASQNLLDFTYPQDLLAIIVREWSNFEDIFGKNKQYWEQRASFLATIRNSLAHNRDESLREYERQIAEGYCNEILNALDVGEK